MKSGKRCKQDSTTGQATLPRLARLLKPSDFKQVFGENVASSDRFFRVMARPAVGSNDRLGMAVSKKVDKRAVVRNRIKRAVRESFRRWRARKDKGSGVALDIVVLARPASASICKKQLQQSLDRHWQALTRAAERKFRGNRQSEEQVRWEI